MSIVRDNLMTREGYSPYCGEGRKCMTSPRTRFNGDQFVCGECGWHSAFDFKFIAEYKIRWDLDPSPIPVQDYGLQRRWWLDLDFGAMERRAMMFNHSGWRNVPDAQTLALRGRQVSMTCAVVSVSGALAQVLSAGRGFENVLRHQPKTAAWGKKQRFQPGNLFKGRKP